MRVAAIYDIHGNLPALEAVIDEVRQERVDHVVVGGDVVPGPMPRETLARLLDVDTPMQFIQGNGEVAVLAEMAGRDSGVPEQFRAALQWNGQQLAPEDKQLLDSWPKTLRLEIPKWGEALFCHATPRNENEIFTRATAEERVLPAFAGVDVQLVVCGHTHMQFDRMIDAIRVVNAGSVGMPFGEPGAYWLLIDQDSVELRHLSYDLVSAAEQIQKSSYPQAWEFATRNVLQPPTKTEMLQVFAKAELN